MLLEEIVRRAPFPLYGLASPFDGRRRVHSAGVSLGEVTHVALHHAPDAPAPGGPGGPELVVDTLFGEQRAPADARFHAALHLDTFPSDDQPRWRSRPLPVDGRDQVFWFREAGERWAAFARVGAVRVVVAATRWDRGDVRLGVVDPVAYLDAVDPVGPGGGPS